MKDKFPRFLILMKGLQINIPFMEAMSKMRTYAKFLKDLLSNKSLPKKERVPGSFSLPVKLGDSGPMGALADFGG